MIVKLIWVRVRNKRPPHSVHRGRLQSRIKVGRDLEHAVKVIYFEEKEGGKITSLTKEFSKRGWNLGSRAR